MPGSVLSCLQNGRPLVCLYRISIKNSEWWRNDLDFRFGISSISLLPSLFESADNPESMPWILEETIFSYSHCFGTLKNYYNSV